MSLRGYLVKRATRSALLAAVEGVQELLYEVVWRDRALAPSVLPAGFLRQPSGVAAVSRLFTDFLAEEGFAARDRAALIKDQERVAACYALAALDKLGWQRPAGAVIDADELRQKLQVEAEHARLFRRMLELLARAGVLAEQDGGFVVVTGIEDSLPQGVPPDPERFALGMSERFPLAAHEIALFRRCAGALPDVLRGREDPLGLLFGEVEPNAADLYRKAAVWRAANRMLGDAVAAVVADLPEGRRLRVLEVGAGNRVGDFLRPSGAAGGPVRLHLHRHLGGLLCGSGSAIRRQRCADRIPGVGHRDRSGSPGLRCLRL